MLIDLDVTVDGQCVRHELSVRYAAPRHDLEVTADARSGRLALRPTEGGWTEDGVWTPERSEPADGPDTETFSEGPLAIEGGRFGGSGLWAMRSLGPRVAARLADITDMQYFDTRVIDGTRMYGLVGGEMMWAEEVALNGQEFSPSVTARLGRVES